MSTLNLNTWGRKVEALLLETIAEINARLGKVADGVAGHDAILARIDANTKSLPDRVTALEHQAERQKGERHVFAIVGGAIGVGLSSLAAILTNYAKGH